jgi:hypothetical protein
MRKSDQGQWRDFSVPFGCFGPLMTPSEILRLDGNAGLASYDPKSVASLLSFARYVTNFLTSSHPKLGRDGPVCPFTAGAIARGLLRLTASPLDCGDEGLLIEAMSRMCAVFDGMGSDASGKDEIYKAIVVVFPNLPPRVASEVIESVQKKLKPAYVRGGMMIGEFYPGCPAPGLHNSAFRPLEAPVPSLAIRRITIYDAPFMVDDDSYVAGYLDRFGEEGAQRLVSLLERRGHHICPRRAGAVRRLIHTWEMIEGLSDGERTYAAG